jgi:hypothetical protein
VTVDVDSVQIRAWDQAIGNGETARMRHYRATLRAVDQSPTDRADVDALCRQIAKRKPMPPRIATDTPRSLVANLADWQVGKGEGDGSTGTVDRILAALDSLDARSRAILQRRFLAEEKATLQDLAVEYGVSAERVRQIEANALKKLRGLLLA